MPTSQRYPEHTAGTSSCSRNDASASSRRRTSRGTSGQAVVGDLLPRPGVLRKTGGDGRFQPQYQPSPRPRTYRLFSRSSAGRRHQQDAPYPDSHSTEQALEPPRYRLTASRNHGSQSATRAAARGDRPKPHARTTGPRSFPGPEGAGLRWFRSWSVPCGSRYLRRSVGVSRITRRVSPPSPLTASSAVFPNGTTIPARIRNVFTRGSSTVPLGVSTRRIGFS